MSSFLCFSHFFFLTLLITFLSSAHHRPGLGPEFSFFFFVTWIPQSENVEWLNEPRSSFFLKATRFIFLLKLFCTKFFCTKKNSLFFLFFPRDKNELLSISLSGLRAPRELTPPSEKPRHVASINSQGSPNN